MKVSSIYKKVIALLLILALVLGAVACGKVKNSSAVQEIESASATGSSGGTESEEESESVVKTESAGETEAANEKPETDDGGEGDAGESENTSAVAVENIPEGFTERDFDTSYSDYSTITLSGNGISANGQGVTVSDSTATITQEGTYLISGTLTDGQIIVDLPGENDKVQLVLDGVNITNMSTAGIYVLNADKVFVTTTSGSNNEITVTGSFVQTDENNVDGAIFSKDDLVLNGQGTLVINVADGHGVVSKDDLKITSGTYDITAGSKGLQANDLLGIAGGDITINAGSDGLRSDLQVSIYGGVLDIVGSEGIEATLVEINDGEVTIYAYDDGINASQKVTGEIPTLTINGGTVNISMAQGDTDALDSNGYLYINGGYVNIEAQFAFDFEYGAELTGGTVIVNGNEVTSITNSMMGGWGGGWGGGPGGGGQGDPGGQGGFPGGGGRP